jgi:hypothetical protein
VTGLIPGILVEREVRDLIHPGLKRSGRLKMIIKEIIIETACFIVGAKQGWLKE